MKKELVCFLILILFFLQGIDAATINAASCSQADVQAAINSAVDGDVIMIPSGSCEWSSRVSIPSSLSVTIMGSGRNTVITSTDYRFGVSPAAGEFVRISSMAWNNGQGVYFGGGNGGADTFRIDNIYHTNFAGRFAVFDGIYYGVIDSNYISASRNQAVVGLSMGRLRSDSGGSLWSEPTGLGTNRFVFFENNIVNFSEPYIGVGSFDGRYGSKLVFRHNLGINNNIGVHDFENPIPTRGFRAWEYYNNTLITTESIQFLSFSRGGTGVFYNNRISTAGFSWMNNPWLTRVSRSYGTPNGLPACDGVVERFCIGEGVQPFFCAQNSDCGSGGYCVPLDGHEDSSGWPCRDQVGVGQTNPVTGVQAKEPAYVWNNYWCTAPGGNCNPEPSASGVLFGFVVISATSPDHLREGRDFYNNVQMPGYTPYTYPHPLRLIDPGEIPSDTTPPIRSLRAPTGNLSAGTNSTTISLVTNEASTCRYSTTSGVLYNSMTNTFSITGSTSHSTPIIGLTDGNTYNYYVKCIDNFGNANPDDYLIIFSISQYSETPTLEIVTIQEMLGAYQQYKRNEVTLSYFLDKLRRWIVFW
ncbi:hypothetical protein FJZ20_01730 [Candidatus Pacearchaeota archaeon]|nr:hypothetical protein [Candidatus Pacearchaeota archaeon]